MLTVDSQMPSAVAVTITSTGPWTWSFTNTAGTVLYLFVNVALHPGTTLTITATYAGTSMTLVGSDILSGNSQINLYRLTSPATGANNFVVTWDGVSRTMLASAISFTGNAATPDSGTVTHADWGGSTSATNFPLSITSTTSGNIVIQGVCYGDPGYSTQTGTKSALKENDGTTYGNNHAMQYQNSVTGTTTPSITVTVSTSWFSVGIEVRAAAATTDQMMAAINRPTNTPVFLSKGLLVYSFHELCKRLERGFAWLTP